MNIPLPPPSKHGLPVYFFLLGRVPIPLQMICSITSSAPPAMEIRRLSLENLNATENSKKLPMGFPPVHSANQDIICEAHTTPELETGVSHLVRFFNVRVEGNLSGYYWSCLTRVILQLTRDVYIMHEKV